MFTGIVEEIGVVRSIKNVNGGKEICVHCKKILTDIKLGDSISTNGVCVTVTDYYKDSYTFYIMEETIRRSNLGNLKVNDILNLERALKVDSRFDGHIVSGHIDSSCIISNIEKSPTSLDIFIEANENILRYIVKKGSVTIDGVSLTVVYVDDYRFKVSIIPHTQEETTLYKKQIGDYVNIECDIVGKYIEKFLKIDNISKKLNINKEFLSNNGFM
ncbi:MULTISPECIES: riboflavin synthase [unclassified Romboutsia]|uniref:riboflavin synthase n=1 Tax=unclassified Romboutsia TaxID=2626894 RepID=UPI0008230C94|nr:MULTISPECIES: riboflavin synthase [unclassified Romboutsia]SCI41059.1 Riboflavin synthase alpha chain [uncultured Clostridium sp.]